MPPHTNHAPLFGLSSHSFSPSLIGNSQRPGNCLGHPRIRRRRGAGPGHCCCPRPTVPGGCRRSGHCPCCRPWRCRLCCSNGGSRLLSGSRGAQSAEVPWPYKMPTCSASQLLPLQSATPCGPQPTYISSTLLTPTKLCGPDSCKHWRRCISPDCASFHPSARPPESVFATRWLVVLLKASHYSCPLLLSLSSCACLSVCGGWC